MLRVLVVDDHAIVRAGLKRVLADFGEVAAVGEAGTATELLDQLHNDHWDIVILDLSLQQANGLDLIPVLKAQHPGIKVLMLSVHSEEQMVARALQVGATGYVTKETAPEELMRAIREVAQGKRYVSPAVAQRLALFLVEHPKEVPHERLSAREFEVIRMIAKGKSVTEIAGLLNLSVKTISTYRSRALEKMNMKSNVELIQYALQHGLIV